MDNTNLGRPNRLSELLWENKRSLAVIIPVVLLCIMFLPNLGVLIAVCFVLIALLIGKKQGSLTAIGFLRQEQWRLTMRRGILLGVAIQLSYSIVFDPLIEKLTGTPIDVSSLDGMRGNLVSFLVWLLIGVGFGGFLEEMVFRGYLITRLKLLIGDSPARLTVIVLLTSVAFGVAHLYQDWSGVISTGSFALIFGYLFIRSNYNLWIPILTHSSANVLGLFLIYTDYDRVLNTLFF